MFDSQSSDTSTGIELRGLSKRFGGLTVLEAFDLTIQPGEFVVLLGPSGCGKSTLLRLIAGLEEPSSGEIRIGGQVVNHLPPRQRNIAMVFQSYALYAHLSVAHNISFPLKMRDWRWYYEIPLIGRGFPRKRKLERSFAARAAEIAGTVGLSELLDRKPRQLSGGQRQRVALARAMVHDPLVFLMDEPLSNLDAQLRTQTRAEIIRLHRKIARTFVYVTHDQIEAMTMGTRVIVLNQGRIQQDGDPQSLYDAPSNLFVAGFIGTPPMNLVPASFGTQGIVIDGYEVSGPEIRQVRDRQKGVASLIAGIRPEHIAIGDDGLAGRIDIVERLGTEQIVSVAAGGATFQVRTGMQRRHEPGDRVRLLFDAKHMHLFDGSSGRRL